MIRLDGLYNGAYLHFTFLSRRTFLSLIGNASFFILVIFLLDKTRYMLTNSHYIFRLSQSLIQFIIIFKNCRHRKNLLLLMLLKFDRSSWCFLLCHSPSIPWKSLSTWNILAVLHAFSRYWIHRWSRPGFNLVFKPFNPIHHLLIDRLNHFPESSDIVIV